MQKLALALVVASFFSAANSRADFQVDTPEAKALDNADAVQFDSLEPGNVITDQLSSEGVTFSPFVIYDSDPFSGDTNFGNFNGTFHCEALCNHGDKLPEFSIHFTQPVRDAAMIMWIADGAAVELTSLLHGTIVEHVTFVNPSLDPPRFLAFLDTEIDQIVVKVGGEGTVIEHLRFRLASCDDADADGVCDDLDNCDDADADGVCDDVDNCADVANADQADFDADGIGDACDACADDADNDQDGDGVCGDVDACGGTVLPEAPALGLRINRFADIDGDGTFETRWPNGRIHEGPYSLGDTAGCSCAQIVDSLELGVGHAKFGCSHDVMSYWVDLVGSD
jgi:hypothetical protein